MLYTIERAYREGWSKSQAIKVVKAVTLPGDVVYMQVLKPPNWKHKPGQYIFLQVCMHACVAWGAACANSPACLSCQLPFISKFEWHPFTISSAPEDEHIGLHIRVAGDWTGDLHRYVTVCACPCMCACGSTDQSY